MRRVRVIPVLLIQNGGLVKSVQFKNHKYVGDPLNAVKIFNEKEVDEIVVLDITATKKRIPPNISEVKKIAGEAFMPLGYGGGITELDEIKKLVQAGVEKVILNTSAFENRHLIRQAADYVGSQSIVVSMDVKKNLWGKQTVFIRNGTKSTGMEPVEFAQYAESNGAGELLVNSIERDGTYKGYDVALIKKISASVSIPVVVVGGAGSINDFYEAVKHGASAVSAGSMFVFQRPHQAVLISYPSQTELRDNFFEKI